MNRTGKNGVLTPAALSCSVERVCSRDLYAVFHQLRTNLKLLCQSVNSHSAIDCREERPPGKERSRSDSVGFVFLLLVISPHPQTVHGERESDRRMSQKDVCDFLHKRDLDAAGIVTGVEDADAGTVRQGLGVNAARPVFLPVNEELLAQLLGQAGTFLVEIEETKAN